VAGAPAAAGLFAASISAERAVENLAYRAARHRFPEDAAGHHRPHAIRPARTGHRDGRGRADSDVRTRSGASGPGSQLPRRRAMMKKSSNRKSVAFSANPILSVRLPMWRSKLVVFLLFMAFVALAGRAFWIQGPGNAFYQKQGESRYQRTIELPATRGKI